MSKIIINYLGSIAEATSYELMFHRDYDKKGKPSSMVLGGEVKLTFEPSSATMRFFENTLDIDRRFRDWDETDPTEAECYKRILITIYDNDGYPIRNIELLDAYIKAFRETFQAFKSAYHSESNNTVQFTFCSATQRINGAQNVYGWFMTYPYKKEEYGTPVYEEAPSTKKKDLRVELQLSSADQKLAKSGAFGFHDIPKKSKLIDKSKYSQLERLHQKGLTNNILNAPYYPHWLSMRVGDTRTFTVRFKGDAEQYTKVGFKAHPHFSCTPETFTNNDEVTIECLQDAGTDTQGLQLQLLGDDKDVVGAINIFYPKPKTIGLEWVLVEKTGGIKNNDVAKLKGSVKTNEIQQWVDKGFKQALIDIKVTNQEAKVLDISGINQLPERIVGNITDGFKDYESAQVLTPGIDTNDKKITRMIATLESMYTKDTFTVKKPLRVFFTYFSCNASTGENTDFTNGVTNRGSGFSFMFIKNRKLETHTEVPHELMHAMGLPHTFDAKAALIAFKNSATNNYMDYDNTKRNTYKWQWEKLHDYSGLK